jgi:hypothetical protein
VFDAISLEFVGVGGAEDLVTSDLGGHDLHNNVTVGEANDETVLGRIVLVLGLGNEALASVVIGLSNTTALVLGLVAAVEVSIARRRGYCRCLPVVRRVLDQLGERLQ